MDSQFVIYTGTNTPTIPIVANQNLQLILQNIDAAINTHNTAPNYSGYNLYCVKQVDGTTHPTNTQNFAEGISKNLCDFHTVYNTFTGTQYVSDQTVITTAINGLQHPALTYVPFSITSADNIGTVYSKQFTGFTGIINSIKPDSANWSDIGAGATTSIVSAFNTLIAYELTQDTLIAGKQSAIATFNNTGNCLAGGATDTIRTTVASLITYVCALPEFVAGDISFGGVTSASDLQDSVQNTIDGVSYLLQNAVITGSNSITAFAISGTYDGKKVEMQAAYKPYYKVCLNGDVDPSGDADYLDMKIVGDGTTITMNTSDNPGKITVVALHPNDNKVAINSDDSSPNFLATKLIGSGNSNWGLSNIPIIATDNSTMGITPNVDPNVLIPAFLTYISQNPDLLAQFQALVNQTTDGCAAPTSLVVTFASTTFTLTWTASGTASSQNAKYKQRDTDTWILTPNIDPANPQTNVATTVDIANLNLNTVYQFAVDSVCSGGGQATSNIYEMIIYNCVAQTSSVNGTTIHIAQPALPTIDTVQYSLWNNVGPTLVSTVIATGVNPTATFSGLSAGNYHVNWRYSTLLNGVTVYSTDASQLNAYCATGTLTVV